MTIYTVSSSKNEFRIYHDEVLMYKTMICLLSISVEFNNAKSIPEVVNISCDEIDSSKRFFNGKRSALLIQVINNKKDVISFNSNHKQYIELLSKDHLPSLTFKVTDKNGVLLDELKSIQMDIEIV